MVAPYVESGYWQYGYAEGDPLNVSVSISGLEAQSSVGVIQELVTDSFSGTTKKRKRIKGFISPRQLIKIEDDAKISVSSLALNSFISEISAKAEIHIDGKINLVGFNVLHDIDELFVSSIKNPTDDELFLLLSL